MKVLMISGDRSLLDSSSAGAKRLALQRSQVDVLDVFVWPQVHSRREIAQAALTTHYDVVTAQDPFWRGLLAWRTARSTGAKLNLQLHTDLSAQPFFRRMLAGFLLRRADSVRVVSNKLRDLLAPMRLSAHVSVLPIYIDIARFSSVMRNPNKGERKTILWVGRFENEKDPLAALALLREVRAASIDARLIMLGKGSLEQALHASAQDIGEYVEFPGWQDTAPYLAQADVVVSTSRHESYGASVIEALAAGVAVVSPDIGIAREAGAIIAKRTELAPAVIEALRSGARGQLKLALLNAEEWAKAWEETLV